jgi:Zn finger protein HypA/HybF involved in hydrogenase expression/translation elongation factor P/translation initiation factor 5A
MIYNQVSDKPCAYITKDKQRVKQFNQNVYLKDGSEFEIELYNGSRKTVLSKIKINGEFINGGGIVLRPGERVFLERYLDIPNKFKFETYTVDGSNETKNAIANNGDVEVLFYEEEDIIIGRLNNNLNWNPTYVNTGSFGVTNLTSTNNVIGNNFWTSNVDYTYRPDTDITFSNSSGKLSFSDNLRSNKFESKYDQKPRSRSFTKKSKSVETGRVEMGSSSNQTFKTVSKNFNSWTVSTSTWKILPESQKPFEKKDLVDKCPKCSTKIKKSSWKFCPECGHQMVRTKTEIHYTMDANIMIDGKQYLMSTYNDTLDNFLKRHENKLIYIKSDSLTSDSLRAIVID